MNLLEQINSCLVPEVPAGNERPCSASDLIAFQSIRDETILNVLEVFNNNPNLLEGTDVLSSLLVFIGENNKANDWNSKATVEITTQLLNVILINHNCNSYNEILNLPGPKGKPLAITLMKTLRPYLQKLNWKCNPAKVECFMWILRGIRFPHLSDVINEFLPTAICITDDFISENRVLGLESLTHIVDNVTVSVLINQGIGNLIFNTVEPLLRIREKELANAAIPCIVKLATKLNFIAHSNIKENWNRFDDVMEILLEIMEWEHEIDMKALYISHLKSITHSNLSSLLRWFKRIFAIIDIYTTTFIHAGYFESMESCFMILKQLLSLNSNFYHIEILAILFKCKWLILSTGPIQDSTVTLINSCACIILTNLSDDQKMQLKINLQKNLDSEIYELFMEMLTM